MAARVLEISRHEGTANTAQTAYPRRPARVYRFPAPAAVVHGHVDREGAHRHNPLRMHLAIELAIGVTIWLTWYLWRLAH